MGHKHDTVSIEKAIVAIKEGGYLLPAIQRKFVWKMDQICVLFDSIMRGYSINTLMMWEITDPKIKNGYKFYNFLRHFTEYHHEKNPPHATSGSDRNFNAIIDGQQRLTAFYIGLYGTFSEKRKRKWAFPYKEENFETKKLYLDLNKPLNPEDDDTLRKYNFRFLTEKQYQDSKSSSAEPDKPHWFYVREILNLPKFDGASTILHEVVIPYLEKVGLSEKKEAEKTLSRLYEVIRSQEIIHYFNETSQEIDRVLDIFIRTNSGGTKLEFADLLVSIAIANWEGDFRGELDDLVNQIRGESIGFEIDRDRILKTCLMLTDANVRFKVQNFKTEQVEKIQEEWENIKECIKATFRLIHQLGINSQSLTSKYIEIPICYYLYKKEELYRSINAPHKNHEQRQKIGQWLYIALLKNVFSGRTDSLLTSIRDVLRDNISNELFPLENIIDRYRGEGGDLRIEKYHIEELLNIHYGDNRCRPLLHLLFPEIDPSKELHIDHLHPSSAFRPEELEQHNLLKEDPELMNFFSEGNRQNLIPNLHLLEGSWNSSKSDKPLAEWIKADGVYLRAQDLLVDEGDLEFKDFKQFYEKRRENLKIKLEELIFKSDRI